jgi:hypothetical protein
MSTPHNPLVERRNAAAEKLNRRRQTAVETSVKTAEESNAFFDKLAVLSAGALTFSVTFLSRPAQAHWQLFILYAAWVLLLIALASCLVRNYSNIGHRFYKVVSDRAESEVALIDADSEVVSAMAELLKYDDAAEPFDKDRELKINRENREVWHKEFERAKKHADVRWKVHGIAERAAGLGACLGFLLLIVFAILNTYR